MDINNNTYQDQIIDLKGYWNILMNAKWRIIFFSIFVTILASIYISGMSPVYKATASLIIQSDETNTVSIDTAYSTDTSGQDYFLTQYEIIRSRSVAEQVIDELNLAYNPEFLPSENKGVVTQLKSEVTVFVKNLIKNYIPIKDERTRADDEFDARSDKVALINAVISRITVEPVRKTQLVNISFEAKDPRLAALVANKIGNIYITQGLSAQLQTTKTAATWINDRLEELRLNVENSFNALQAYRTKENLIDIEAKGVRSIASDELESLTQSYLAAKQKRYEAETIALFVNQEGNKNIETLLSVPEISNNASVSAIKRVEIESEKKVSELSFRYGKKHPKLVAAKAELESVQKNLSRQVFKLVSGINKDLVAAQSNERRLLNALNSEKRQYQVITNKEQTYLKLSQEVEVNRNIYNSFLQRFKEMDITTDLETQKAQVIDPAEIPLSPIKPKKSFLILLSLIGSFAFAVVFAFISDALNDNFRTPNDVESKLKLRLLGLVPLLKLKRNQKLPTYAFFDEDYKGFSEAIRTLRTGYVLSHIDESDKILMVTSSVPDEGKTTTAINIAFSMSQMEKTLLIEADMRRPSFTKIFSLAPYQHGLSNVILGTESFVDSVIHDEVSGLDILSAGLIPPNPLELLSSDKYKSLLEHLKAHYDRIIIDSPPTLAVSDAQVLSRNSDSVIFVVCAQSTKQSIAKKGLNRLLEVSAKVDGVVLNQIDIKKLKKDSDYKGYYDAYGYSQDKK